MTSDNNIKIPSRYTIGGQDMEVEIVPQDSPIGGQLGVCNLALGKIWISENQTDTSMQNTFIHEFIHTVFDTCGHAELSGDEALVGSMAGFILEALRSMEYKEETNEKGGMINE